MQNIATVLTRQQLDFLADLAIRNINKSPSVSIALAQVLSSVVTVPTSPVVSVDNYFNQQAFGVIDTALDSINGIVPVDYRLIKDIAKCFFRFAYDTVHGGVPFLEGSIITSGVNSFFRIDKHFAPVVIENISANHGLICGLVNEFKSIFASIRGMNIQGEENVAQ